MSGVLGAAVRSSARDKISGKKISAVRLQFLSVSKKLRPYIFCIIPLIYWRILVCFPCFTAGEKAVYGYFTDIASSNIKTVADSHRHPAYDNKQ